MNAVWIMAGVCLLGVLGFVVWVGHKTAQAAQADEARDRAQDALKAQRAQHDLDQAQANAAPTDAALYDTLDRGEY